MNHYDIEIKTETGMMRETVRAANTADAMLEIVKLLKRKMSSTGIYHRIVSLTIVKEN